MTDVADVMNDSRSKVLALVEREWMLTRSKTLAYENVAARIGRSSSWVQKLLSRRLDSKRPDVIAWLNIRACYERVCERVEARADKLSAANAALERANATTGEGGVSMGARGDPVLEIAPRVSKKAQEDG